MSGHGTQPKRPVTYSSVRFCLGVVNRSSVTPYSTSSPRYMNAVKSDARAACCMLWVTMQMQYSLFNSSISSSILEVEIGSRAERLVHQQHLWLDRDRARDAKALLLAARQAQAALVQLVLDLVPQGGTTQRLLDAGVHLALGTAFVQADAESDVVIDGQRERRRLLEHHADLGPQQVQVDARLQDILAVQQNLAGRPLLRVEIVDPVHDAQQGGLAAAARPDEGRDLAVVERQLKCSSGLRTDHRRS